VRTTSTSYWCVSVATSGQSEQTQQIWNKLMVLGHSSDVTFSRNHETEASGLTLMAIAGYNPEEAIVSGLEWQQILPEKLHLSFLVHTRQMHRELLV
jgi:hypothetical protein